VIIVDDIKKSFGAVDAVDGISFEAAKGEVVGLLGPNGAGKTTTMRIITGFIEPDRGFVTVDGLPMGKDAAWAKAKIGYLPENAPIYPDMEVYEYLEYIARLRSIAKTKVPAAIRDMVEVCGLGDAVGRTIGKLSKGFKQRVGLAAAMIHRPPILIFDEPTSGLDPNQIAEIRSVIKEIGKESTVLLSTHIMQEVEATCSRALIINAGKIVGHGTISELIKNAASPSSYIIGIRAGRREIESRMRDLSHLEFSEWMADEGDARQRLVLRSKDGADHSEDIFNWAVRSGFVLSELSHETTSLEDVFRELTQTQ
jgi:ABC-2 type transport system ATP-binding protein